MNFFIEKLSIEVDKITAIRISLFLRFTLAASHTLYYQPISFLSGGSLFLWRKLIQFVFVKYMLNTSILVNQVYVLHLKFREHLGRNDVLVGHHVTYRSITSIGGQISQMWLKDCMDIGLL